MTAANPRAALRAQLASGELVVAPGVFDGISASLVARLGFSAAYLTGAGVAASGFGLPDIGLLTMTEMVERARVLVRALGDTPLIADADTGYGAPLNVVRTVREYESTGVAAIQLEDQAFPKKCGHLPDKELIGTAEFVRKLEAATEARTDPDLVIIARTDARGPLGLDEAIARANAYAAAGADVIFVEAPEGTDEIERIAKEVTGPLLINLVIGGLTPLESTERLQQLGYAIAIHPSHPLGAAAWAMLSGLADLAGQDPTQWVPSTPAEFFNLVGLAEWSVIGSRFADSEGA
jgi:2-methylisocitrate lyase-like PEP mutase family enzyme